MTVMGEDAWTRAAPPDEIEQMCRSYSMTP